MKHDFLIVLLMSLLISSGAAFARRAGDQLEKLRSQIHSLNLLNGLELDREQARALLKAARDAEQIRVKAGKLMEQNEEKMIDIYSKVLKVAKTGSLLIPEDTAFRVHEINRERDMIKADTQERLAALTEKISDILKPHQAHALDEYRPCIIPPVHKGLIGQADDPTVVSKMLERVHSMPQGIYDIRREELAERAIERVRARARPGSIVEERELKSRLLKTMDEARHMSDIDFIGKKEEIARSFKAILKPKKPPIDVGAKIERFLLQPEIIPLLEQRLAY